jgi:hypothetical protein
MTKEPAPDERYQDALTQNVFEVVGLATSSETCQRLVIYRVRGRERLFTLSLDRWEELLDSDGLAFLGWSAPAEHRSPGSLQAARKPSLVSHAL